MKLNLQIKFLIAVILLVIFSFSVSTYLIIQREKDIIQDIIRQRAIMMAQALDASIGSRAELENKEKLQSNIYKTMHLNADVTKIIISVPTYLGLKIIASNQTYLIDEFADVESISVFQKGIPKTGIIQEAGTRILNIIIPITLSGQTVGTYEIGISLESMDKMIFRTQGESLLIILSAVLFLFLCLFILMRRTFILPIRELEKGLQKIGSGDLEYKIQVFREDEIGHLARNINEMAEKLEESYKNLGIRVEERTKQLAEKISELMEANEELERFNRLATGREIKMMGLEEEIRRLREQLEQKKR